MIHFGLIYSLSMSVCVLCLFKLLLSILHSDLFRDQIRLKLLQRVPIRNTLRVMFGVLLHVTVLVIPQSERLNSLLNFAHPQLSFDLLFSEHTLQTLPLRAILLHFNFAILQQPLHTFLLNDEFLVLPLQMDLLGAHIRLEFAFIDVHCVFKLHACLLELLIGLLFRVLLLLPFLL
jgi:hypothetical protein